MAVVSLQRGIVGTFEIHVLYSSRKAGLVSWMRVFMMEFSLECL